MRYCAFISYSHADEAWARWLMRRLETWRVPKRLVGTQGAHGPIGDRLGAFFRDRDELTAAGDLGASLRKALDAADALVVICSPAAARSHWVQAEITQFRASGRGDRVLCFVVAGAPGATGTAMADACFPPALLAPDASGRTLQPLAADARSEGDGRDRAFLKLVAALLGVGYDALAQREAHRRQRRLAVLAAASLSGMAIALALAATAFVARDDAQRRQAQAEDILGFMLGDLRTKLGTVGRLDLMRAVDDKATAYFATLDARDMTDRALEEQARSLTGIGQVRLDEGQHADAMAAFREAHARSTVLQQRQPGNGQRLFDLAQAEYWIGFVAWQQGRHADAGTWLARYRDSATRLAAMDPTNFAWQQEAAYGSYNLAVLDESRGRYASAERTMRQVLASRLGWLRMRPGDTALRASVANTQSWLGSLSARQGRLAEAETFFAAQAAAMQRNLADQPDDARWRELRVDALILLADVQARRGAWADASASIGTATPLALALARQDPANTGWQLTPGICRWWQARLAAATQQPGAAVAAAQATAIFARAHKAEPDEERVRQLLAKSRNLQAQLALAEGDAATAGAHASAAVALLEPAWRATPNEDLRLVLADSRALSGEALRAAGDPASARRAWREAEQLLLADADAGLPFDRLEQLVTVLRHLGRPTEAHAHEQRLAAAGQVPLRPPLLHAVAAR